MLVFQAILVGVSSFLRLVPSRYVSVFWGERRLGITLRRARGKRGVYFHFVPSHETPRAPQPNPQSSLTPKTHK